MDTILSEIEAYLEATGMSPTAFGAAALSTPNFVFALRSDKNFTWYSVKKARKFMAENPPERSSEPSKEDAA